MVSTTPGAVAPAPPPRWWTLIRPHQRAPAEGWVSVMLLGIVLLATAWTVALADVALGRPSMVVLTIGGLLTGLLLAKVRVPDLLAHLLAIVSGVVATMLVVIETVSLAAGGRLARAIALGDMAQGWLAQWQTGQPLNDPVLPALLLGVAVWLVSYTSSWVLFRCGWLTTALGLPAIISLTNLGYASAEGTLPLLVVVVIGTLLAARHAAYRRQVAWSRARLPYPRHMVGRFLAGGVTIALLVGGITWTHPLATQDNAMRAAWERLQEPWAEVTDRWNDLLARFAETGDQDGGSYSAFGQSFTLGGSLDLSDDPVILLESSAGATRPIYLAGQRYDRYDGHGWTTTVDDTFQDLRADGRQFSPRLSFRAGQGVQLSPEVTTNRSQVEGGLTVMRPKGKLLFTIDTYLTADRRTNVELSWQQLVDQPFPLAADTLKTLPLELRLIGGLLLRGAYTPGTASPLPGDPALATEIETERSALQQRFLDVRWEVSPSGQAQTLYVTGQVAVYDDVAAVFSQDPVAAGDAYRVTGLTSMATPDQLRAASTDYPAWITDRYLQLPDTMTDRTRQVASELVGGQASVFDAATAVETYVRATIAYNEQIEAPPDDQDVVDYALFDSQEGYCEYYASAMAVLLRAEGVPTRVVGGYYPAPYDANAGGALYREQNAHLWVEVFFPEFGWIPFEPTANRETLDYGDIAPLLPDALSLATPAPTPEPQVAEPTPTPVAPPAAENPPPDQPASSWSDQARIAGWMGIMLVTLVVMSSLGAAVTWFAAFHGLSPVSSLYARALRAGSWLGVRPAPSLTPHEYAARVGRVVPAAAGPARTVADLYAQERYAGQAPDREQTQAAREAWRDLRGIALGNGRWFRRHPRGD